MNMQRVIEDLQELIDFFDELIDEAKAKVNEIDDINIDRNTKLLLIKNWLNNKINLAGMVRQNKNYGGGHDKTIGPRKSHDFFVPGRGHDHPDILEKNHGEGGGPPSGGPPGTRGNPRPMTGPDDDRGGDGGPRGATGPGGGPDREGRGRP